MKNLLCPVSAERVDRNAVRVNGLLTTLGLLAYVATGSAWLLALLGVDIAMRASLTGPASPMTVLAREVASRLGLAKRPMDKASKVFASRIGLLFALSATAAHFLAPGAAPWLAGALAVFTMLESVFDLCVGCVVYTHLALPLRRARESAEETLRAAVG